MKHRRVIIIRFTSQMKMANQTQFLSLSTSRTTQAMIPLTIHQCSLTVTARRAPSQKTCREVQRSAPQYPRQILITDDMPDRLALIVAYEVTVTVSDGRERNRVSIQSHSTTRSIAENMMKCRIV